MKSDKKFLIFSPTTSSKHGQSKGGQIKLSFGMMFSIILIIFFIAFAFYIISKFIGLGETFSVGKFVDDFQSNVDKLWKGEKGSQELEYSLPKKIEWVCFANLLDSEHGTYKSKDFYESFKKYSPDNNLFFYPMDVGLDLIEIEHIDIEKITRDDNPLCFEVKNGKVKIGIEKNFGEALVSVISF